MENDKNKRTSNLDIDSISRRGSLRDTLDLLLEAIKKGSLETDLYFAASNMAFHLGDLDKAEQLTARLLELDPDHVKGWLLFGEITARKNEIIRTSNPGHLEETFVHGRKNIDRGFVDSDRNMENQRKDMSCDKPKENLNFDTITYADICARQGYYNKALKIYQDLLKKNPDNIELRRKIADIEKRLKDD